MGLIRGIEFENKAWAYNHIKRKTVGREKLTAYLTHFPSRLFSETGGKTGHGGKKGNGLTVVFRRHEFRRNRELSERDWKFMNAAQSFAHSV